MYSRFTNHEFRFTMPRMTDIESAYNSALDYLYSFVDYSLKHSSELAKADFNLDRMRALMAELGDPEAKYPVIHVAGTKGKGSVSALCAAGLQAAGYKVGLYTSPAHFSVFIGDVSLVSRYNKLLTATFSGSYVTNGTEKMLVTFAQNRCPILDSSNSSQLP